MIARAAGALLALTVAVDPLLAQSTAPSQPVPAEQVVVFRESANRMTVPVKIGAQGPYPFVVDTGAERSVISRELAASLGLGRGKRARLFGFAGVSEVQTVHVPLLSVSRIGTASIEAPSLAVANLGAPGMLGIDALQGHRVSIDFGRKRMTLVPTHKRASGDFVVRARDRLGQLIVTNAKFEGQQISVVIDTGSPISVGNSAMRALARRDPRRLGPISVVSVTGQSFDATYVAVNDVMIGDVRFGNLGLAFADAPPFARFGLDRTPALILGMDTLRLFRRVDIDFANREIQFSLPRPPIDFSRLCGAGSPCTSFFRQ
ncbi:aspartyl protease family protein [Sphingomonas sp. EC-HK361]|uniref:aspartyl protease family protein n=1 Tax=Sphingomonas sp. EC-HK361 TaxID=2038397 RepID=UPI0018FEC7B7|nr:aspartyl protease family protein [Sphingomonas sp. EC-HK361]